MTYQPQNGNGAQPIPQTYPQTQSSPPGPSPQVSPMSAPQQAQAIPTPMATTPPPNYYPPAQQAPAATGPPALRALQGQLRNPVPIIVAGVGLLLVAVAFFLPLAAYTWQGEPERDPMGRSGIFVTGFDTRQLGLSIGEHPAIPLLLIAVAVSVALADSRRWLLFGKLATIGLGVTAIAAAFGAANEWRSNLQGYFDRAAERGSPDDGDFEDDPQPGAEEVVDDVKIDFDVGLWLLIAGIVALIVATLIIRAPNASAPPFAAPMPLQRPAYPQVNQMAPQSYQATQAQPPAAPPPSAVQPPATGDDGRDVVVHDDPPSLSIYKPPKKES